MKIRLAKLQDEKQVLKLLVELGEEINEKYGHSPHNTEVLKLGGPKFKEIIKRKEMMIFVAEEKKQIIGLMSFYILPNMRHGYDRGHIEDVVVSKKKRGQGAGTKLMNAVKKYCRANKIKVIKLDSGRKLTTAHRFYKKLGGKFTEKMFRFDL